MNLLYLQYALEVARAGSINKAAENLYMGQPNLSRAIKDLEASLGITIFERSSRGMIPTPQGEELLRHAKRVVRDVEIIENLYLRRNTRAERFSVSAPCSAYVSHAFAEFSSKVERLEPTELFYNEVSAQQAVKNLLDHDYDLGVVRLDNRDLDAFQSALEGKGLFYELIAEFSSVLVMSESCPLARLDNVNLSALSPYVELSPADPSAASLSAAAQRKDELPDASEHRIFALDRASCYEILARNENAYMWSEGLPTPLLSRYGLVQKSCRLSAKKWSDLLIYRDDHVLTRLDKLFITELCDSKRKFIK